MRRLSKTVATSRVNRYEELLEACVKNFQKNFKNMDFENADRRVEVEKIIEEMILDCNSMKKELSNLTFES